MTIRVFVDTSVLFSALYSSQGYARDLLVFASTDQLILVTTEYVLDEIDAVLKRQLPDGYRQLKIVLDSINFEMTDEPTNEELSLVEKYVTDPKDVPIVAGAIKAKVKYLITFDRKHILTPNVIEQSGLQIVEPITIVETHFGDDVG